MDRSDRQLSQPAGLSLLTRIFMWLTTSPWRNDPPLAMPVSDHLSRLQSAGWFIRQASPRYFVIWRGERLYGGPKPVIVLPDRQICLGTLERSAVAVALSEPALLHDDRPDEELERLDKLAHDLGFIGGTADLTEQLIMANREIQAALTPYYADRVVSCYPAAACRKRGAPSRWP